MTVPASTPVVGAADVTRIINAIAALGITSGKAVSLGGTGYVVSAVSGQYNTNRNDVIIQLQFKTGRY